MISDKGIEISKNIKAIEKLKSELLERIAALYKVMSENNEDVQEQILSELSSLIVTIFVLGKRLGIGHVALESEVLNKLKIGILKEEQPEKDFKDYSELLHYLKSRMM